MSRPSNFPACLSACRSAYLGLSLYLSLCLPLSVSLQFSAYLSISVSFYLYPFQTAMPDCLHLPNFFVRCVPAYVPACLSACLNESLYLFAFCHLIFEILFIGTVGQDSSHGSQTSMRRAGKLAEDRRVDRQRDPPRRPHAPGRQLRQRRILTQKISHPLPTMGDFAQANAGKWDGEYNSLTRIVGANSNEELKLKSDRQHDHGCNSASMFCLVFNLYLSFMQK